MPLKHRSRLGPESCEDETAAASRTGPGMRPAVVSRTSRLTPADAILGVQRSAGNRAAGAFVAAVQRRAERRQPTAGAALGPTDDVEQVGGTTVARDLAIEPTRPDAAAPELTAAQLTAAVQYNGFRFKDPYSLAVVRDLVGVPRFPAVSDEDLARAVASYQAQFGLTADGQAGPATTTRLTAELGAEGLPQDAEQLRRDNYVSWSDVVAPARNMPGAPGDASGFATFFQWDVNFSTSLRNGWLIQEIANTWSNNDCAGTAIAGNAPTPHYWEAWWVDASGNVLIPTAISGDRTRATASAAAAGAHDMWRRNAGATSRGNWRMSAHLFTTTRLPAGFAIHGVPDAVDLASTIAAPNSDDLGQAVASRAISGRWDGCVVPPTHVP